MKKTTENRSQRARGRLLPLNKETVKRLTDEQLETVNGGTSSCLPPDM